MATWFAKPAQSRMDRRTFFGQSALILGGLAVAGGTLPTLAGPASAWQEEPGYGPLRPVRDRNTGLPLLLLPDGFSYESFGWTGDRMADGTPTPPAHDGMAVVEAGHSQLVLVRNHEVRGRTSPFAHNPRITYDLAAGGGTTNLTFSLKEGRWGQAWPSLLGTSTNCAGGATYAKSWLTCEETLDEYDKTHGWVFEVPAQTTARAVPLKAMGRFVHEAVAVDRQSGIVYETEDRGTSGLYRFIPLDRNRLDRGGYLQMLKVATLDRADLRRGIGVGSVFPVEWVDIADPQRAHSPGTNDTLGVFMQGLVQGGAIFSRLEGIWYNRANQRVYFLSTSGGDAGEGQVWEYDPRDEELRLFFESTDEEVLDNPDNIGISADGRIVLCEDGDRSGQRLLGLGQDGHVFPIAQNAIVLAGEKNGLTGDFRGFEWAGATWSPDGRWLFANIQTPGVTFAITGPWR
jgi:secreted PhoX family phosphatase